MSDRDFHLGDILSVTSGKLVSPRLIKGVYDICDFITGDSLWTHQLLRACPVCKDELLRQHPGLSSAAVPNPAVGEWWVPWLKEQIAVFGETLPVRPLPEGTWESRAPLDELQQMMGPHTITTQVDGSPVAIVERIRREGGHEQGHTDHREV